MSNRNENNEYNKNLYLVPLNLQIFETFDNIRKEREIRVKVRDALIILIRTSNYDKGWNITDKSLMKNLINSSAYKHLLSSMQVKSYLNYFFVRNIVDEKKIRDDLNDFFFLKKVPHDDLIVKDALLYYFKSNFCSPKGAKNFERITLENVQNKFCIPLRTLYDKLKFFNEYISHHYQISKWKNIPSYVDACKYLEEFIFPKVGRPSYLNEIERVGFSVGFCRLNDCGQGRSALTMSNIIKNYCVTQKGMDVTKTKCGKNFMKSFIEQAKKETDGILEAPAFRKASALSTRRAESMNRATHDAMFLKMEIMYICSWLLFGKSELKENLIDRYESTYLTSTNDVIVDENIPLNDKTDYHKLLNDYYYFYNEYYSFPCPEQGRRIECLPDGMWDIAKKIRLTYTNEEINEMINNVNNILSDQIFNWDEVGMDPRGV